MPNVEYEWDIETVAKKDQKEFQKGDVIDHHFCDTYKEVCVDLKVNPNGNPEFTEDLVVLVRYDTFGTTWAYMENGKLPEYFEDAYGNQVTKVPARFFKEVENQNK